MKGKFHVRFLGEEVAAMSLPYPTVQTPLQRNSDHANRADRIILFPDIAGCGRVSNSVEPGRFQVKDPKRNVLGLTWTALDVGGPCVETFG